MKKCLIAGGGAAGMMAAITAARNGNQVILFEKNEKLGKKLFITGKGRCNFTNAGDSEDIFNSVVTNRKFLYSAFNGFSNYDTMGFFDELGLAGCESLYPGQLSGGMSRRVSIARALCFGSPLLILDEPLKGLDEQTYTVMRALTGVEQR